MDLKWNESEYEAFRCYLKKAVKEDLEVQQLLRQFCANNDEQEQLQFCDMAKAEKAMKPNFEHPTENGELQTQIAQLRMQNTEYETAFENKLQEMQRELAQERQATNQLKRKLEELEKLPAENLRLEMQLSKLRGEYNTLENSINEELRIYQCYQSLSPALQASLSGIFRGNSLRQFLFCGVQKQNIELLWDAIKIRVIGGNVEELEKLQAIFIYFFHAYNSTFEKPLYELQAVEVNEKFDTEKHIRTSNSLVSGTITNVVFRGYFNTNSKKIERKSVVKL